jgi:hypothetical protein
VLPDTDRPCFCIDNSQTDGGASVNALRTAIEKTAAGLEHVQVRIPVEWLAVQDSLAALEANGKQRVSMSTVMDIARTCNLGAHDGIPLEDEVHALLRKFHDLGLVSW